MHDLRVSEIESQINQFFEAETTKALAKATKDAYKGVCYKQLLPFCKRHGITRLDDSFNAFMDKYAISIRERGISAQTTRSYLTTSKLLFRFHDITIKHTYRIPRADKQKNDLKHEMRWFSGEEIALCKTYKFPKRHTRNHLLVRILVETGARVDEVAHIRVCDIRLESKTILISHSKTIPRPVFISPESAIYMKQYLAQSFPDPHKDAFKRIFPGKNMMYKIIVAMLSDLGLKTPNDGRGPHTFRHYTATNLRYNMNMDLDHVARLLGDTPETISTRYLHPTAGMLQNLVNKASGY
ncbi:MAG: site-specific integrase [Proteobacteria bacterium]|nr:site-specific integrase [Pseudomonadota bacterium]MBU1387078.1 site-specific integrase [Pseudomonadota bacterium]MBU1541605.1 site-specific integrase [Pseudomonadota bacterium]MBU2429123.1 site-specific integrase [Pseudomonadota bacterium]MBU2479511.1 site-specific integrase [Pseudomonadota bacterium]